MSNSLFVKDALSEGASQLVLRMEASLANKGKNMPVARVITWLEEELAMYREELREPKL